MKLFLALITNLSSEASVFFSGETANKLWHTLYVYQEDSFFAAVYLTNACDIYSFCYSYLDKMNMLNVLICTHIEHNSDKCYWQINYIGFTRFGCISVRIISEILYVSSTNCFHVSLPMDIQWIEVVASKQLICNGKSFFSSIRANML